MNQYRDSNSITRFLFAVVLTMVFAFVSIVRAEPVFEERTAQHLNLAGTPTNDTAVKKLALGDVNNDGIEDVIVARRTGAPLLFVNVSGVLTQQTAMMASTPLANNAYDVELLDVNGDNWLDMVFGRASAVPALFINLGENVSGVWQGFDAGSSMPMGAGNVTMVEAADIDGDADTDLVMITSTGGRRLLINDGSGGFSNQSSQRLGSGVLQNLGKIQLGDVDNDNDIDIIGVAASEDRQSIFLNDGTGNFPDEMTQNLELANLTYVPVGADFNGDDIFDYRVYADNFSPTAFMSLGTFTGVFADYLRRFDGNMIGDNGKHGFAHIRDIDGDGDPDYIMSSIEMLGTGLIPDPRNELNEMVITAGVFSGNFEVYADVEWRNEESYDVLFVDVNADGNLDVFFAHEGRYAVYINDALPQTVELSGFNPVLMEANVANTLSVNVTGGVSPVFFWSLGDGSKFSTGSDPFVEHTYTQPGRYQVSVTLTDSAGSDQLSFWQIVHAPLVAGQAASSSTVIYEPRAAMTDRVWTVNFDNSSVTAIDANALVFEREIAVGEEPASLVRVNASELWVVNKGDSSIAVIDLSTNQVTATLDVLPAAARPHGIVASNDRTHVYVALEALGQVVKINTATRQVVTTVSVEATPRHLAISADNASLYVSRFITPPIAGESTRVVSTGGGGEVRIVDTLTMSVQTTMALVYNDVIDSQDSARGIPNYVMGVALSPDGQTGVVPANSSNIYRGVFRDGYPRAHDRLVRSMLSRIDTVTRQEQLTQRFDFDDNSQPTAALFGPSGNHLFVVHEGSRSLHVLDSYANQIIVTRTAGITPRGLVLSPDGQTLFVHHYLDRSVLAYDLTDLVTGADNSVSEMATVSTVVVDSLNAQVLQGKKHFFDAADPRLSSQAYLSCSACHDEAGHDGRVWDFADGGEGLRNTIDLRGRAGIAHGNVHWTANFDEIHDFENDVRGVFQGTGLMSDVDFALTTDTLGAPKAGLSAELDALSAYVATLSSVGFSPYRDPGGVLTADAQAGRGVYRSANCTQCHTGVEFTDSPQGVFHNIGTVDADTGGRLGQPLVNGGLDTPTLRGLWHGAPFLHDGSAATLEDAVRAHTDEQVVGFDVNVFTAQQMTSLVAYLLQIDDHELWAPHPNNNYPPDVVDPGDQQHQWQDLVSLQIVATDLENTLMTYSATNLPPGMVLDINSGVIDGMATTPGNYQVAVDVTDADAGQSTVAFAWLVIGDSDNDSVPDHLDNCTQVSNIAQLDTDNDGFGNLCDADLDYDCITNFGDLALFEDAFLTSGVQDADFNGDGVVNFGDLVIFSRLFLLPPGPSGLVADCDLIH